MGIIILIGSFNIGMCGGFCQWAEDMFLGIVNVGISGLIFGWEWKIYKINIIFFLLYTIYNVY